ncbi:hypothetical protein B0T22DRAFT_499792 [Podospora appendiculata]|uniref:Nephrocystin 3-like N-terminal domain-containing protein n=1 Tax=Podospora appendiculata TaxID=314037 RepID=A0AAE0XD69_9PEZI|nr:hypothetical protein B0T22DRAFT_499792 [Podospora appendiculata]
MYPAPGWTRKVFRLRMIPDRVSSLGEVASLLGEAFHIPADHVLIYSLATTTDIWETPPSKIATLQFRAFPQYLRDRMTQSEWRFPLPWVGYRGDLILDTHFQGITPFNDVDSARHNIDCIAISGLASHPFGSWQPRGSDKTFMWIRDVLPSAVPGVRAVIYGYDSDLMEARSFQTIGDIATSLTLHLKAGGWDLPSSKPVIFLAHSLGGIILKEAIVQAADRERSIVGILDRIVGALMFGVPNLGMRQSHLMAMVEGQANEALIRDLSGEIANSCLQRLNQRFHDLPFTQTAKILWAYETKESHTVVQRPDNSWNKEGPPTVLVSPDSATSYQCQWNKSVTIPINEDHSNMVKFSPGDANLRLVLSSITLHESLYSPDLDLRIDQIEQPFDETFKWVFDLPKFTSWLQGSSNLFWIHGKPGSGKSTLMKYIFRNQQTWELLHNWASGSMEIRAGFFFHFRGTSLQKSFEGVLKSLIIQILAPVREAFLQEHGKRRDMESVQERNQAAVPMLGNSRSAGDLQRKGRGIETWSPQQQRNEAVIAKLGDSSTGNAYQSSKSRGELERQEREILEKLHKTESARESTDDELPSLADRFRPYTNAPETQHRSLQKLENILRWLLDQDKLEMDLVLFFDALDEFEGNLDMISRFLLCLVQKSSMSKARVKLKKHFVRCPNIKEYVVGTLVSSPIGGSLIRLLVPAIVDRSNGVFLWVALALKELIGSVLPDPQAATLERLMGVLQRLPDDLNEFYNLIIQRISITNRRRTFALLELLARQTATPLTAAAMRDAVLLEGCNTFQEAVDELQSHREGDDVLEETRQLRKDIAIWGGGLVEIRTERDGNSHYLQLLHQTVLEFVTGEQFKRMVLGDWAVLPNENGHSFYLKYLISDCMKDSADSFSSVCEMIYHHSEQSELTTGCSQMTFISTTPRDHLNLAYEEQGTHPLDWQHRFLLLFAVSNRLTLCLRDWITQHPGQLRRLALQSTSFPLLTNLVFHPHSTGVAFQKRHLQAVKLLLDAGFPVGEDTIFLDYLLEEICRVNFGGTDDDRGAISKPLLHELAKMEDSSDGLFSACNDPRCSELHPLPSRMAEGLIHCGATPTSNPHSGEIGLYWVLRFPFPAASPEGHTEWDCKQRYNMCTAVLSGVIWKHLVPETWADAVSKFDEAGYDTRQIRQTLLLPAIITTPVHTTNFR